MRSSKPIRHSCNSTEDGLQRYPDQGLDETNKNYANKNVSEQERNKSFSTPPYIICKNTLRLDLADSANLQDSDDVLYLCQYCLANSGSYEKYETHSRTCHVRKPPGEEIYRHNQNSVFQVDGSEYRGYCQKLCWLSREFIQAKVPLESTNEFMFYVLTENYGLNYRFVGYFSKCKMNDSIHNLSCIMVLPDYRDRGYGRLLVEISYYLTRMERKSATPEKPLSEAAAALFKCYWREVIIKLFAFWRENTVDRNHTTIQETSAMTGIATEDVSATLLELGWLKRDVRGVFVIDLEGDPSGFHQLKSAKKAHKVKFNKKALQCFPVIHLDNEEEEVKDISKGSPL